MRRKLIASAIVALAATSAQTVHAQQKLGDVFYVAMENHDWQNFASGNTSGGYVGNATTGSGSNLALLNNPAAPFVNSLITGTSGTYGVSSSQVSYALNYYNAGAKEHPSEPNYVWQEAGTNFNPTTPNAAGGGVSTATNAGPTGTTQGVINGTTILNDNDSSAPSGNIFPTAFAPNHLTGQLNAAGISWQNFQEDYQILNNTTPTGGSPTVSKSGISTTVQNPYNNSFQYNYAEKHNPMAFFADTANQNVNTFDQLRTDLQNNSGFGRYNWITPNQYNDMHSALTGGFTYNSTTYTGDQAGVATGDNFLKTIIPLILATSAYQNNGAIVIWDDESEQGDTTSQTVPEIVISPLAHANVGGLPYASTTSYSHSSDIKTLEELFGLPQIDNPIPTSVANTSPVTNETYAGSSGFLAYNGNNYASVPTANDLSDLFQAGAVPEPTSLTLMGIGGLTLLGRRRRRTA